MFFDSPRAIFFFDLPFMIILISLVYSATRYDEWGSIFVEAFRWGFRLLSFLIGIGLGLYILNRL